MASDLPSFASNVSTSTAGAVLNRGGSHPLSFHHSLPVCLFWPRVADTRKARLKPCPSARPG